MYTYESKFIKQLNMLDTSISVTDYQLYQLKIFYNNLIEWNENINLTAITDVNDVYTKHYLDSLTLNISVPRGTLQKTKTIIDIGSGAGFPGIPIAIFYENIQMTLVDSLKKRINFINDTINKLNLNNVKSIHERAEKIGQLPEYREKYDICVSRAVSNLCVLNEYCIPLIKKEGYFVAYKGEGVKDELHNGNKCAKLLGAKNLYNKEIILPETNIKRINVVYKKETSTPKKYPRKEGIPIKSPLFNNK